MGPRRRRPEPPRTPMMLALDAHFLCEDEFKRQKAEITLADAERMRREAIEKVVEDVGENKVARVIGLSPIGIQRIRRGESPH